MSRYTVVEIARNGAETHDDILWATEEEAEAERYTLARVARFNWLDLGYRYEVREVPS